MSKKPPMNTEKIREIKKERDELWKKFKKADRRLSAAQEKCRHERRHRTFSDEIACSDCGKYLR